VENGDRLVKKVWTKRTPTIPYAVLVWDNVPQNFQCSGRPGRDMSWTCPGHSIQNYIYILHMYMNYKILINVKLLISQDPVIGFMRF